MSADITTDTDEFTRRRIVSENATSLTALAYEAATHVIAMRQCGASVETVLAEVWARLEPREARILSEPMIVNGIAPLLTVIEMFLRNENGGDEIANAKDAVRSFGGDEPLFDRALAKMEAAIDRTATSAPARLKALIKRLFREAQSPLPDQAPAIQCWVMLHGISTSLLGSLSETEDGLLRLMSPAPHSGSSKAPLQLIEQFFAYEDVMSIALLRSVTVDAPRIVLA